MVEIGGEGGKCYFIYCERIFQKLVFQSVALSNYPLYLPAVRVFERNGPCISEIRCSKI